MVRRYNKIWVLLLLFSSDFFVALSWGDGFQAIDIEETYRPLIEKTESVLKEDKPDIQTLFDLFKIYDPVKVLKTIYHSQYSSTKVIDQIHSRSRIFLLSKMRDPNESLFTRYKIFEYLNGYLDGNIKIKSEFNLTKILKGLINLSIITSHAEASHPGESDASHAQAEGRGHLLEITGDPHAASRLGMTKTCPPDESRDPGDFENAQVYVHGAYFIFRYAYLSGELTQRDILDIGDILRYFSEQQKLTGDQLVALRGSEGDAAILIQRLAIIRLIHDSFSEFLEKREVNINKISVHGIEYIIDQRTGVIKANVKSKGDTEKIVQYWTGDLSKVQTLREGRGWVIINALLPLFYNFYVNTFLVQPGYSKNCSVNFGTGPNCYNTSALYHGGTLKLRYFKLYDIKDFIASRLKAIKYSGVNQLEPGNVIVYYMYTPVPDLPDNIDSECPHFRSSRFYDYVRLELQPYHSAVYLAGGFTFSKRSYQFSSPFTIKRISDEFQVEDSLLETRTGYYRLKE